MKVREFIELLRGYNQEYDISIKIPLLPDDPYCTHCGQPMDVGKRDEVDPDLCEYPRIKKVRIIY